MVSKSIDIDRIAFSTRVYQLLLHAYPTKFQQEYGAEMAQVFQDCCLRTLRQGGKNGMARLWAVTLLDLIQSVISEHTHKETDMSKSKLIKFSGWAFILASFGFMTLLGNSNPVTFAGSVIASLLLAIGMLGLRVRYGGTVGMLGRNSLLFGVIGMVLLYVVVAYLFLMYFGVLPTIQIQNQGAWILLFGGPAIGLLGLTLFGLAALHNRPMPRLNWLPAAAGIWYPLVYLFLATYVFTHDGVYPQKYHTGMQMVYLMQFVALCVFGAIVANDTPQEIAAA
jgi:hypothetical protein